MRFLSLPVINYLFSTLPFPKHSFPASRMPSCKVCPTQHLSTLGWMWCLQNDAGFPNFPHQISLSPAYPDPSFRLKILVKKFQMQYLNTPSHIITSPDLGGTLEFHFYSFSSTQWKAYFPRHATFFFLQGDFSKCKKTCHHAILFLPSQAVQNQDSVT